MEKNDLQEKEVALEWIYAQNIYIYVFAEFKNNLEDKKTED